MPEEKQNEVAEQNSQVNNDTKKDIIDGIVEKTKQSRGDEGYDVTKKAVEYLLEKIINESQEHEKMNQDENEMINKETIDAMIAEIDQKLSLQMDEILHNEEFKKLESAWRSLKFLVDRTDFSENIKIEMFDCDKVDLAKDFAKDPDITLSGLYKLIYSSEYGTHGGEPYGAIIGNYEFGPGKDDIDLLRNVSKIAADSHAPFIASPSPAMFDIDSYNELPDLTDMEELFKQPKYTKWRRLREEDNSRYLCLALPRFLLRTPYGKDPYDEDNINKVESFNYQETIAGEHENYLWGNAAFAFATRLTESFAKYRLCNNIIGVESGGNVQDLPMTFYESLGNIIQKIPTEIEITDKKELSLAGEGFISLAIEKGTDNATIFSANSIKKPSQSKDSQKQTNSRLEIQLPYMFIINRIAHYIKVIQRRKLGSYTDKDAIQEGLMKWINRYKHPGINPPPNVRCRKPLKDVSITVTDNEDDPGWYNVELKITPHYKYMGLYCELSLVGKLDIDNS